MARANNARVIQDLRYFLEALASDILQIPARLKTPDMNAVPAPRWILECRNCASSFVHSEVGAERTLVDYLKPTAPKFSVLGEEMECPHCKVTSRYMREDLRYRPI